MKIDDEGLASVSIDKVCQLGKFKVLIHPDMEKGDNAYAFYVMCPNGFILAILVDISLGTVSYSINPINTQMLDKIKYTVDHDDLYELRYNDVVFMNLPKQEFGFDIFQIDLGTMFMRISLLGELTIIKRKMKKIRLYVYEVGDLLIKIKTKKNLSLSPDMIVTFM